MSDSTQQHRQLGPGADRPAGVESRAGGLLPPPLPWRVGAVVSFVGVLVVTLSELDRLSAQIPTADARVHPLAELVGPKTSVAAWTAVFGDSADAFRPLLAAHLLANVLLILAYAGFGWWLHRRNPRTIGIGLALLATAALDLAENLLIGIAMGMTSAAPPELLATVVVLTRLKWGGVLAFVLAAAITALRFRDIIRGWMGLVWFALRIQRFSVLLVGLLAALTIVPREGVFDQLPDVQRSWPWSEDGLVHSVAALVVLGLLTAGVFLLGRLRGQHLWDEQARGTRPRPAYPLVFWLVAPCVLWGLALAQSGDVLWGRLGIVTGILVIIVVVSHALRRWRPASTSESSRVMSKSRIRAAELLGDVLAVGLFALSGIGLVRAFIIPLVLGLAPGISAALTSLGVVVSVGIWPIAAAVIGRLQRGDEERWWYRLLVPGAVWEWRLKRVQGSTALVGLLMLGVAMVPGWVGGLGVAATVMLSAGIVALFIGGLVLLGQDLRPPEALERLGFRTTPVVLLLVVLLLIAALSPANTRVHGLRALGGPFPARPTLAEAFRAWESATRGCAVQSTGGDRWRPLLLYAAEGGGIRAAYWTANAIDEIAGPDPRCRSALFSAGASGGAVGLTVAQSVPPGRAAASVVGLSRSDALAEASLGMFLRDALRGGTGLPLTFRGSWSDRAALVEESWEREVPQLGRAYLGSDSPGPSGRLILNTTAVSSGCRTLLSQMALPAGTGAVESPIGTCDGTQAPGGRSVDFFARDAAARCVAPMRASTAALTASRFPYVTPAAVVGCPDEPLDQLVDGGYVENSGVGTLVDLWPALVAEVRAHNDRSLTCGGLCPGTDLIVPIVVYLTNSAGTDLAPPAQPITEELLVPPVAFLRGNSSQNSPSAHLQRARGASDALFSTRPDVPVSGLPQRRVYVIYPATEPAVTAPLGWTLSRVSLDSMDAALQRQRSAECGPSRLTTSYATDQATAGLVCDRGYGVLGDLLQVLRDR